MYKLDNDLKYTWKKRSYPRLTNLVNRKCYIPNYSATIDSKGRCFHCYCDGWVPWPSGNLLDFNSIEELFNNKIAKKIQKSTTVDGSFKFCNTAHCGIRDHTKGEEIVDNYTINFGIDNSCNLKCPSCREVLIFYKKGKIFDYKKKLADHFLKLIENFYQPLQIVVGSDGDAFASLIYRDFLYNVDYNKKRKFILKTNGLLIEKRITNSPVLKQISKIEISIDAATEEIYNLVRPGNNWKRLLKNLDFIKDNLETKLSFNFVIQKNNFSDIYPFIDFCQTYNAQPTFSLLEDWGTWNNFKEHSVNNPDNRYYNEWLVIREDLIRLFPVFRF